MFYLPRTPNGIDPPFPRVLRLGSTCPKRVINSVDFDDARISKRLVIGFRFAEAREQLCPSIGTRLMRAYAI
jgi:hypothetical protein